MAKKIDAVVLVSTSTPDELDALGFEALTDIGLELRERARAIKDLRRQVAAALDRTRPVPDMTGPFIVADSV